MALGLGAALALGASDAAAAAPKLVKDICPGFCAGLESDDNLWDASAPVVGNGYLYFVANDGSNEDQVWRTDGTAAGTAITKTIAGGFVQSLWALSNGSVVFERSSGSSTIFWTDGPNGGVKAVPGQPDSAHGLFVRGNDVYFSGQLAYVNSAGIYKSTGSTTTKLAGAIELTAAPLTLGAKTFMAAREAGSDDELYVREASSTTLIRDIRPGTSGSRGRGFVELGAKVYFVAVSDPADGSGFQIWKSDGTLAGTTRLLAASSFVEIETASDGPNQTFAKSGSKLFFYEQHAVGYTMARGFWVSDGTAAGSFKLMTMDTWAGGWRPSLVPLGSTGKVIFAGCDVGAGCEPYVSDGTTAGTKLLKDIAAGNTASDPKGFVAIDNEVYFEATDDAHGAELWKTDGTPGGTVLVADIVPGPDSSNARAWGSTPTQLFLSATTATGKEVWVMARDTQPAPSSNDAGPPKNKKTSDAGNAGDDDDDSDVNGDGESDEGEETPTASASASGEAPSRTSTSACSVGNVRASAPWSIWGTLLGLAALRAKRRSQ